MQQRDSKRRFIPKQVNLYQESPYEFIGRMSLKEAKNFMNKWGGSYIITN